MNRDLLRLRGTPRAVFLRTLRATMSDESTPPRAREAATLMLHDWCMSARPDQVPPDTAWSVWLILTGRGWGKNRTASEWVHDEVNAGRARRVALVARTVPDVRDTVVEGESGILATAKPWNPVTWEPSKRRLTWASGAIATTYSADKPDQLRGPQHDLALADELASWRYLDAWDQLMFGLRLGPNPRVCAITTPRPIKLIRDLIKDPSTSVVRGRTYDNLDNLAPLFKQTILTRYEGTRKGRQELDGELLDDAPGALWKRDNVDRYRVADAPGLVTIVIGVDPSGSDDSNKDADECGIVAAGVDSRGHVYVLDDATVQASPAGWGRAVVTVYSATGANRVVAEANYGGEMVRTVLRSVRDSADRPVGASLPVRLVHASRGKRVRAEPVSSLYEQGRVHHVGSLPELEDELCTWEPDAGHRSPNRLDALVWAVSELAVKTMPASVSAQTAQAMADMTSRENPWKY